MSPDEYAAAQMRYLNTAVRENGPEELLVNAALGLCGEAGEFADVVKKHRHQGHPLDHDHLTKELGDIHWYVAAACLALGVSLNDVLEQNLAKLERRYPGGKFSRERSLERQEGGRG